VFVQLPACSCQASHLPTLIDRAVCVLAKRYAQFANMTLFSKLPKINSKTQFLKTIKGGYLRLTNGCVPEYLLNAVSKAITDYYYDQYRRFRKQYPKSVKRYSTFQIKDLNHPTTFEIIIKVLREKVGKDYDKFAPLFLNMTLDELRQFKKNREEFYQMF
jgi:hypothetical protein